MSDEIKTEELLEESAEEKDYKKEYETLLKENETLKKELNYLRQIKSALDKTTIISKTDPNGIITDANEMFEKISGYKKEELIGKPHSLVRHPNMPKAVFKKLWETITQGKIFKGVIKNRKKDGGEYYVMANIVPITDEEGKIKEYIAIRQDITKRVQMQEEKGKFVNSVIKFLLKKFKNPIFSIVKYSQAIEKENDLEKIKKYALFIQKDSYELSRSYQILSTLTAIQEKRLELNIEPVNVLKILNYIHMKYSKLYPGKIEIEKLGTSFTISSDKKLLLLFLEILYINTVHHTKKKSKIKLYTQNAKPVLEIVYDGSEIKNNTNSASLLTQLQTNGENLGVVLTNKIAKIFNYTIEYKGNTVSVEFETLPPKNVFNKK